jgi:hypothetical protein
MLHVADVDIDPADVVDRAAGGLGGGFQVSQTWRVCASMSPTPAIVPSARREVMPEMKTSRPRASIIVACEKCPLGRPSRLDLICCFTIAVLLRYLVTRS